MLFHWQCDLAPFLSDSGASRYLITTIPSSSYVFDGSVNITLQAAAQHICNSFAGLKISIPTMDLVPALCFDISKVFFCGVAQCKQPPAGLNQVVWLPTMAQGTRDGCVRDGVQG